jgi:SAM-dependent methyltransferase
MISIFDFACCPRCNSDLTPRGGESAAALSCTACETRFPIIEGIPRLLPDQYDSFTQESFEKEWSELKTDEDTAWGLDAESRIPQILDFLGYQFPEQLKGKRILDIGCGDGSLTDMMARTFAADVIGTDLTRGMMRTQLKPNHLALFIQGDACCLPYKPESFDVVWSMGVLHHTPDTRLSFMNLPRLLRQGGRVGVWLYGKDRPLRTLIAPYMRRLGREFVFKHFSRKRQDVMIDTLAHLGMAIQRIGVGLGTRRRPPCSLNEKKLKLRDSLTVNYARFHSRAEVAGWFEQAGLRNINCRMIDGAVVCYGDK